MFRLVLSRPHAVQYCMKRKPTVYVILLKNDISLFSKLCAKIVNWFFSKTFYEYGPEDCLIRAETCSCN